LANSPFGSTAPPIDATRGAALQGIRDRSGAPAPAAPAGGVAPGGGGVPEMFAGLTQAIMQTGLTDEVLAAFEQFIQFFQQVVAQAQGGAQPGQPAPQAPAQAGPPVGPPAGPPVG
jgi:hypothetical protein